MLDYCKRVFLLRHQLIIVKILLWKEDDFNEKKRGGVREKSWTEKEREKERKEVWGRERDIETVLGERKRDRKRGFTSGKINNHDFHL